MTREIRPTFATDNLHHCLLSGERIPKGEPVLQVRIGKRVALISRDGLALGVENLVAHIRDTKWLGNAAPTKAKRSRRRTTAAAS